MEKKEQTTAETRRAQRKAEHGEDFVNVVLKPTAPDYLGYCSKRYARTFHRKDGPFRLTRAEFEAYFKKRNWFEAVPAPAEESENKPSASAETEH